MSELNMSSMDISSADSAAKIGEITLLTPPPASTGVYQFVSRAQGENVVFERVPYDHWRLTADFPEMEFRWVQEASTRLASLIAGESHITQLPQDQTEQAATAGMALSVGTVDAQRVFLGFQGVYVDAESACGYKYCDTPWLDINVRKAMSKALDKPAMNQAFFANKGKIMYMNHMAPNNPYNNPEWERNYPEEYGFDPDAGRALLSESGYNVNNPLEIDVYVRTLQQFTQSADVMEAAAAYWNDIGIKTNLRTIDSAANRAANRALEYTNMANFHGTPDFDIQGWRVRQSSVIAARKRHRAPGHRAHCRAPAGPPSIPDAHRMQDPAGAQRCRLPAARLDAPLLGAGRAGLQPGGSRVLRVPGFTARTLLPLRTHQGGQEVAHLQDIE